MRLQDLVEQAYARCVRGWSSARQLVAVIEEDPALNLEALTLAQSVRGAIHSIVTEAEFAAHLAGLGCYEQAAWLSGGVVQLATAIRDRAAWKQGCLRLSQEPTWAAFGEACDLASRIDCLLATLESSGGVGGSLATSARSDLNGLLVMADWCEEHGQPATAAEARRLAGLIRYCC